MDICRSVKAAIRRSRVRTSMHRLRSWRAARKNMPYGYFHYDLMSEVVGRQLPMSKGLAQALAPEVNEDQAELAIRQRIISLRLSKYLPNIVTVIAKSVNGPVVIGAPEEWRKQFSEMGLQVAQWRSRLNWMMFVIWAYLRAVKSVVRFTLNTSQMPGAPDGGYAVLINLTEDAARTSHQDTKLETLATWYCFGPGRLESERNIWANVTQHPNSFDGGSLSVVPMPFPALPSLTARVRFFFKATTRLVLAGGYVATGRWQGAFLAEECVSLCYLSSLSETGLASTYLFNNSDFMYRPLWTFWAEQKGARIVLAFYSTNCAPFHWRDGGRSGVHPGYRNMSWSNFFVWDQGQENFIREVAKDGVNIRQVGIIPYSDNYVPLPDLPENAIAVFDITVFCDHFNSVHGFVSPYYSVQTVRQFLLTSWRAITAAGKVMLLKTKRNTKHKAAKGYLEALEILRHKDNVIVINPRINAARLIANAQGVISLPYTSTSVVARFLDVPTVFFDPTAKLATDGDELHGVEMINDKQKLIQWAKKL